MIKNVVRKCLPPVLYFWSARMRHNFRRNLFELLGSGRYSKMAAYELDDKLSKYLNFKKGTFVEVGANDGITQSNTYYLEKILGWKGVLIEPVPKLYRECKKNRKDSIVFNCALVSHDNDSKKIELNYDKASRGLMSKIGLLNHVGSDVEKISVVGRALTNVLEEAALNDIDFFSLDVEGFEIEVLKGLDLEKWRPCFILVETNQMCAVDSFLEKYYERIASLTHHDHLYHLRA